MDFKNNFKILIGDVVKLSVDKPNYYLKQTKYTDGIVVEIRNKKEIKVVFNFYISDEENIITDDGEYGWYDIDDILDIEREYMLLSIEESQGKNSNRIITIVNMVLVEFIYSKTATGYYFDKYYEKNTIQKFLFHGKLINELVIENVEDSKRFWLSNFESRTVNIDGIAIDFFTYENNSNSFTGLSIFE